MVRGDGDREAEDELLGSKAPGRSPLTLLQLALITCPWFGVQFSWSAGAADLGSRVLALLTDCLVPRRICHANTVHRKSWRAYNVHNLDMGRRGCHRVCGAANYWQLL